MVSQRFNVDTLDRTRVYNNIGKHVDASARHSPRRAQEENEADERGDGEV